jgi:ribosomal protein RSM22 (predicted rRNA methylase)
MSTALTWDSLDWKTLDRLRDQFLSTTPSESSYWRSRADLANYNLTFAQRIGWKWDAVLAELTARRWRPPPGPLVDWGCGSGIAGRRILTAFDPAKFKELQLFDRSALAVQFAAETAKAAFPAVEVSDAGTAAAQSQEDEPIGLLAISHVLNELTEHAKETLRQWIGRANALIWVEPGTYEDSRSLIAIRQELQSQFHVIAPCTHQAECGLLALNNKRHWCHSFAKPPHGIMADSYWVRFGQRAGVDLRSLPYSFLALERKIPLSPSTTAPNQTASLANSSADRSGLSRCIGRARVYKGFLRILSCQEQGVREFELQKRTAPEIFKQFKNATEPLLWRWTLQGSRIITAEPSHGFRTPTDGAGTASHGFRTPTDGAGTTSHRFRTPTD